MPHNGIQLRDSGELDSPIWETATALDVSDDVGPVPQFSGIDIMLLELDLEPLGHHRQAA